MWARTWSILRIPATLQLSWLYAVGFGGFVAFSVYLPTFLANAYDLEAADAAARTAGFVVLAVVMRPVGGMLSDRLGPVNVSLWCFAVVTLLAAVVAFQPGLVPVGTIAFLGLAAALGTSSGATFALVAKVAPPDKVGAVTGVVGAAGGLGGFVPPLVMGAVYQFEGDYGIGFALLAATGLATLLFTLGPVRRGAQG
jgi:NNP family nitrate/nitrite transporter-like MFS transporter